MFHAVAYVSSASPKLATPDAIDALLIDARDFNRKQGVTGVLLHNDGGFFQYFEGPANSVEEVYQRIKSSSGHFGLIQLYRAPIEQPQFEDWYMGFAQATKTELQGVAHTWWLTGLTPELRERPSNPAVKVLLAYWHRCVGQAQSV